MSACCYLFPFRILRDDYLCSFLSDVFFVFVYVKLRTSTVLLNAEAEVQKRLTKPYIFGKKIPDYFSHFNHIYQEICTI